MVAADQQPHHMQHDQTDEADEPLMLTAAAASKATTASHKETNRSTRIPKRAGRFITEAEDIQLLPLSQSDDQTEPLACTATTRFHLQPTAGGQSADHQGARPAPDRRKNQQSRKYRSPKRHSPRPRRG